MSKGLKIFLGITSSLVIVSVLLVYIISSKINPDEIKKIVIQNIESTLPNVSAKIETIEFGIGFSVNLLVKNFRLTLKEKKIPLVSLREISVKVPILSILTGGGTIDIFTESPEILLQKLGIKTNWSLALEGMSKAKIGEKDTNPKKNDSKIKIPSFIKQSKINFSLSGLKVNLNLKKGNESTFVISKVIAKNINLDSSTGFEVSSKLIYQLEKGKFFKTSAQIIGELMLGKLIEDGKIDSSLSLNIESTTLDGLEFKIPNIKGKVSLKGSLDELVSNVDVKLDHLVSTSFTNRVNLNKEVLDISKLNINISLDEIKKYTPTSLKKSLSIINFNDASVVMTGGLHVNLKTMYINPEVSIDTKKKIIVNVHKDIPVAASINGKIKGKKITLKIVNDVLDGIASASVNTIFDPSEIPSDISKFKPVYVNLDLSEIKVGKTLIQKILYKNDKNKKKKKDQKQALVVDNSPGQKVSLPPVRVSLSGKRIFISREEVSLSGSIDIHNNKIESKGIVFRYGTGILRKKFSSVIHNTKNIDNKFTVDFENVNVSAFNAFFPPYLKDIKGHFKGHVKGSLSLAKKMTYSVFTKIDGRDGELQNLNLESFIMPMVQNISFLKGKIDTKKLKISDKFKKIYIDATATDTGVNLKSLELFGHNAESRIKAAGYVSMMDKKSKIRGVFYLKALKKELVNTTGQDEIPFNLKGNGFVLLPDVGYTAEKLLVLAGKKELKNQRKKINTQVKKEKKKVEEKLKKKAKDLLKGFKF